MSRKPLVEMTRRHLAHARAGTIDQAPDVFRVPASHYTDPDRFTRERKAIFGRLPLVLAFSAELRRAGSYRSIDAGGTPVLISRAKDGELRAFANSCRHRGAVVVPEGTGRASRFACPYHGWTYDDRGALCSVLDEAIFGDVDRSAHGLTPLPIAERSGLVFVRPDPEARLDLDAFLCGYDLALDELGLGDCFVVGRQTIEGPNWKVAYDGYLDFYHLPILHRKSFGPDMPNRALYDAWGPHQRMSFPLADPASFETRPEEEWPIPAMTGGVWTVFPHVSIAVDPGPLFMVSQLFPGDTWDTSVTCQTFFARTEPDDALREKATRYMAFMEDVVRNEDYATGLRLQRALQAPAHPEVLFGRNEGGGQRFHSWVDALLDADDASLTTLWSRPVGPEIR